MQYLQKMIDIENLNVGRKSVHYPTSYPLPKKMGQSAYRSQFEHKQSKAMNLLSHSPVINLEIESEKIF